MSAKNMIMDTEQADSLRELGNIGAAHAATTLSTMLSTTVGIQVPEVTIINLGELHAYLSTELAAHVIFEIQGELNSGGYIILHVPKESVIKLTNLMVGHGDPDPDRVLTEMDNSAIDEIGNIMISAFLDACAELLGLVLLPSPPMCILDIPHAVIESIMTTFPGIEDIDEVVMFKTELLCADHHIVSDIMLLPSVDTLGLMLERLQQLLRGEME